MFAAMIYLCEPKEPAKRTYHLRAISAERFWKMALIGESLDEVYSSAVLDKNHSIVVGIYDWKPTKSLSRGQFDF
jgi:hypothetical protein